jgi:Survival motor neuron (SMN) interacting protein 1 (SIP1)
VQYDFAARTPPPGECADVIPDYGDRRGWHKYVRDESAQPFSAVLARLDNTLAAACLKGLATDCRKEGGGALTAHMGLWMYGLMVRLEKPVFPDVSAMLRQVATLAEARRGALPQVCTPALDMMWSSERHSPTKSISRWHTCTT